MGQKGGLSSGRVVQNRSQREPKSLRAGKRQDMGKGPIEKSNTDRERFRKKSRSLTFKKIARKTEKMEGTHLKSNGVKRKWGDSGLKKFKRKEDTCARRRAKKNQTLIEKGKEGLPWGQFR